MRALVRWSNQLHDGAVLLRTPVMLASDDIARDLAELDGWGERAASVARTIERSPEEGVALALELAQHAGTEVRPIGEGQTLELLEVLATVAAADLSVARVVETHLRALAVLRQARDVMERPPQAGRGSTWGVFDAESPSARLTATAEGARWTLSGRKQWCSLAGSLTHAIITAHVGDTTRRAFAVDLRDPGVRVEPVEWTSRGLAAIPSGPVTFDQVVAAPVGGPNWYAERPGHAWGGVVVAACWYGGAVGVARRLTQAARERQFDQIGRMQLGELDVHLHYGRAVLAEAAAQIDGGGAIGVSARVLALRVRSTVARLVDSITFQANRALGPGPLAVEEDYSRRVADLAVYVRQEHGPRDAAALGEIIEAAATGP